MINRSILGYINNDGTIFKKSRVKSKNRLRIVSCRKKMYTRKYIDWIILNNGDSSLFCVSYSWYFLQMSCSRWVTRVLLVINNSCFLLFLFVLSLQSLRKAVASVKFCPENGTGNIAAKAINICCPDVIYNCYRYI